MQPATRFRYSKFIFRRPLPAACLAFIGLGALAASTGCGESQNPEEELGILSQQLDSITSDLRSDPGSQRDEACLNYAIICERASAMCLEISHGPAVERCLMIGNRCDVNLRHYCDGLPGYSRIDAGTRQDAGPDSDGWTGDSLPEPHDAGPDSDGWTGDSLPEPHDARPDSRTRDAGPAPQDAGGGCFVGGCSSQLCSDTPGLASTCEWYPRYTCYATATCERQESGKCAWTPTQELQDCLSEHKDPAKPKDPRPEPADPVNPCHVGGCSGEICSMHSGISSICLWQPHHACYKRAICQIQASGTCGWTLTKEEQECLSAHAVPGKVL